MRRRRLLGTGAAVLLGACGGHGAPAAPPAPEPGSPSTPAPAAPSPPLQYRLRGLLAYEVERYDSLVYASMPGAPQISAKRGVLTVRSLPGQTNDIEVRLDSLQALEDTRLAQGAIDSSLGSRWQLTLGTSGPRGGILGGKPTILSGQMEAFLGLLFPILPHSGLQAEDSWSDSTRRRIQVDAFEAYESAARASRAMTGPRAPERGGLMVEARERLSRTGTAMQAGQTMTLTGTGLRWVSYGFAPEGWVKEMQARDSLDLVVTISPDTQTIPVRWRSTFIARLRDVPPR